MEPSDSQIILESAFDLSPDLLGLLDREGRFQRVNPVWMGKTGYDPSALVGAFFADFMPEVDKILVQAEIRKLQAGVKLVCFVTRFESRGGKRLHFECQLMRPDSQSLLLLRAYDLTPLKESEQELSESREKFRFLADSATEGIVISEKGVILEANDAMSRMSGFTSGEIMGQNFLQFVPSEDHEKIIAMMRDDKPAFYEIIGVRKNGSRFPMEIQGQYMLYRGRRVRVTILRDVTDKKRLLEMVRQDTARILNNQEHLFAALTQNTQELIAIVDAEGKLKFSGIGNKALLGFGNGENLGVSVFDLIHPDDREILRRRFADLVLHPGATDTAYFRLQHKDGSWRHVELTIHNLLEEGTVRGVVCNLRDVSERIRAQERLMESERFHRAMSENAMDAVIVHDADGDVQYLSPSVEWIFGHPLEKLEGKNVFEYVHPEDLGTCIDVLKRMRDGEMDHYSFEARVRHLNGTWRHVEMVTQNLLDDPVVRGFVVNLRDVTDRKKAESALRESEARLRSFFHSSSQIFALLDLEGRVVDFNGVADQTARSLFGVPLAVGRSLGSILNPDLRERLPKFLEAVKNNEIKYRDYLVIDSSGQNHWFDFTTNPVKDIDGKLSGVCVMGASTDERRKTEQKLLHVERLAAIGQVTGAIAHEIRNPLSVISALAREKVEAGDPDGKRLTAQAEKLNRLMEDILEFSKKSVPRREAVELSASLQSALASAKTQAGKASTGVEIQWEGDGTGCRLAGDPARIEQALHNLILNAFQALDGQGRLTLGCRCENDRVQIKVEDDGLPMPEKDQAHIFDPFYTTKKLGTGLGLAISRKIAEDHGGTLEALRRESRGMTFLLILPKLV